MKRKGAVFTFAFGTIISILSSSYLVYLVNMDGYVGYDNGQKYTYQVYPHAYLVGYLMLVVGLILAIGGLYLLHCKKESMLAIGKKSRCPKCHAEIRPDWKNCPNCGTTIENNYCYRCGKPIEPSFNICPYCGNKMK